MMESPVRYGELKYIVSFFVVTVEDINCSGNGEWDMLIIPYQYWPGRVVGECIVDGSNHFGVHHDIQKFWSEKVKRVVVWGVGCGGIGGAGRSGHRWDQQYFPMVQRGSKSAGGAGDGSYSNSSIISFKSSITSRTPSRIHNSRSSSSSIISSSCVGTMWWFCNKVICDVVLCNVLVSCHLLRTCVRVPMMLRR